jgi:hypothetical protein
VATEFTGARGGVACVALDISKTERLLPAHLRKEMCMHLPRACGRGWWSKAGQAGFARAGATVGLAWDAGAGALLVAVDGADPTPLFPEGLKPGPAVGAGLFPALSGSEGCRVDVNLGQRPFRHTPPAGFLPCSSAVPAALEQVCVARAMQHFLVSICCELLKCMCGCTALARCSQVQTQDAEGLRAMVICQVRESADRGGSNFIPYSLSFPHAHWGPRAGNPVCAGTNKACVPTGLRLRSPRVAMH